MVDAKGHGPCLRRIWANGTSSDLADQIKAVNDPTILLAANRVSSFEEIKRNIPMVTPINPNSANSTRYHSIYADYDRLDKHGVELFSY